MAVDHVSRTRPTRAVPARDRRWHRPLVASVSLTAVAAFVGWIAVVALTLPVRYEADNWNVAWAGFDLMLLISLLTAGWAVARQRPWADTALVVGAVILIFDAWFDVTTAAGTTATLVSVGFAAGVELPAATGLAWAATLRVAARRARSVVGEESHGDLPVAARPQRGVPGPQHVLLGPVGGRAVASDGLVEKGTDQVDAGVAAEPGGERGRVEFVAGDPIGGDRIAAGAQRDVGDPWVAGLAVGVRGVSGPGRSPQEQHCSLAFVLQSHPPRSRLAQRDAALRLAPQESSRDMSIYGAGSVQH